MSHGNLSAGSGALTNRSSGGGLTNRSSGGGLTNRSGASGSARQVDGQVDANQAESVGRDRSAAASLVIEGTGDGSNELSNEVSNEVSNEASGASEDVHLRDAALRSAYRNSQSSDKEAPWYTGAVIAGRLGSRY
jgi:hypothetical protein